MVPQEAAKRPQTGPAISEHVNVGLLGTGRPNEWRDVVCLRTSFNTQSYLCDTQSHLGSSEWRVVKCLHTSFNTQSYVCNTQSYLCNTQSYLCISEGRRFVWWSEGSLNTTEAEFGHAAISPDTWWETAFLPPWEGPGGEGEGCVCVCEPSLGAWAGQWYPVVFSVIHDRTSSSTQAYRVTQP